MPHRRPPSRDVFINLPFGTRHEQRYLAFIAAIVGVGLVPRCVIEVPYNSDRLRWLVRLIGQCAFSLHDLSEVRLSRGGGYRVPRFNMPFELGLAVAVSAAAHRGRRHQWRVLEGVEFRLQVSLSDLNGYDVHIHHGTAEGTLRALANVFVGIRGPLRRADEMLTVYEQLRRYRRRLPQNIFEAAAFQELVVTARALTRTFAEAQGIAGVR